MDENRSENKDEEMRKFLDIYRHFSLKPVIDRGFSFEDKLIVTCLGAYEKSKDLLGEESYWISGTNICHLFGLSASTVSDRLAHLKQLGIIQEVTENVRKSHGNTRILALTESGRKAYEGFRNFLLREADHCPVDYACPPL